MSVCGVGSHCYSFIFTFITGKWWHCEKKKETKEERFSIPLPVSCLSCLISRCLADFVRRHLLRFRGVASNTTWSLRLAPTIHWIGHRSSENQQWWLKEGRHWTIWWILSSAYTRLVSGPTGSCSVHPAPRRCTEDNVRTFETWCMEQWEGTFDRVFIPSACAWQCRGSQPRTYSRKATNRKSNNVLEKNMPVKRQTDRQAYMWR